MEAPAVIQPDSATFVGRLVDNGNLETSVMLVLGQIDGGTTVGDWRAVVPTGEVPVGRITITVNGLTPNTVYFFRFVANNAVGEMWSSLEGSSGMFRTPQQAAEPVISQSRTPSRLEPSIATLAGTLVGNGGLSTTVTLFFGPTDGGTSEGAWANQQSLGVLAPGSFETSITGFSGGDDIFFRFSAANSIGRSWATVTDRFTAPIPPAPPVITQQDGATGITTERGTVTTTLVDDGDQATMVRVHFGTTDGGTQASAWANAINLGAREPGTYNVELTSLPDDTRIFFRFVASNADGTTWAGPNSGEFTTAAFPPPPDPPQLTQQAAINITQTSATLPARLVSTGGQTTSVRAYYGTTNGGTTPSAWDRIIQLNNRTPGSLTAEATNLEPSTLYFYRFEATNADGTTWATPGTAGSFTTAALPTPEITQEAASDVTQTAATLPARLVSTGGLTTSVSVFFGTSDGGTTPLAWDREIPLGNQTPGAVEARVSNLAPNTRHFYRFAAMSAGGTTWAIDTGSFTTRAIQPPEITQQAATAITQTAATLPGQLLSTDGQTTSVSVFFGTTNGGTTPLAWDREIPLGNQTPGPLETRVSNLTPNTRYFYRFEAMSAGGTTWATDAGSFITRTIQPPEITQQAATGITQTGATLPGQLVSTDGQTTSVSVFFGTRDGGTNPSVWDSEIELGNSNLGALETRVSNLEPNTRYFYRFAATSAGGTTWATPGTFGSFTTEAIPAPEITQQAASAITLTAATLSGRLVSTGGQTTSVIIYFGTRNGGTTPAAWEDRVELGTRTAGLLETLLTNLQPDTRYFYRFAATSAGGTTWADAGDFGSFTTVAPPPRPPVLSQNPPDFVGQTSANLTGILVNDGEQDTTVQLYYGTSDGGTETINWSQTADLGLRPIGAFEIQIDSLSPETTYFFRFNASNEDGTVWASAGTFTTAPPDRAPVIRQNPADQLTANQARLSGTLVSDGQQATTISLYYGQSDGGTAPGSWSESVELGLQPTGDFEIQITGLQPATDYLFRFAATNPDGTSWVEESGPFTTAPAPIISMAPELTQDDTPSVNGTTATLSGTLLSDGGMETTVRLFYGTVDGGTTPGNWSLSAPLGVQQTGDFQVQIENLLPTATYFFRFAATNDDGTTWADSADGITSDSLSTPFIPTPQPPPAGSGLPLIKQDATPRSLSELSATLSGTLESDGSLPTSVTLFYGTTDGGTRTADWAQSLPVDLTGIGDFQLNINGLRGSTAYFYRFRASNAIGLRWASPTATFTTSQTSDADGDGLPDAWERIYGSISASNGSPDRDFDNYSDMDEFLAGTSPIDPTSNLDILMSPTAAGLRINWESRPSRSYCIEAADALGDDTWTELGAGLTSGSFIDEDPPLRMRIYRIRVEPLE